MEAERNCAFQYAKMTSGVFRNTVIVCDETSLTLSEAKALWAKHYPDAAKWIKGGDLCEMVVWINMDGPDMYGETLAHISTDAESNGVSIWETVVKHFDKDL